jgi:ABC-type branched-subunit amino acid transport system permease subunit
VLVGAIFIALLPTVSADVPLIGSAHGQDVVFGLIVIGVMLLLPTGFAGLLRRLRELPGIRTAEKEG